MRTLFLPDNLMSIMYEEQKLLQSELIFSFRKTIPFFKTDKNFSCIKIYPPVANKGCIIRPCNCGEYGKYDEMEGFVLGYAGDFADEVLSKTGQLKKKSKLPVFSILSSRSWYFADFKYDEDKSTSFSYWEISNIKWVSKK